MIVDSGCFASVFAMEALRQMMLSVPSDLHSAGPARFISNICLGEQWAAHIISNSSLGAACCANVSGYHFCICNQEQWVTTQQRDLAGRFTHCAADQNERARLLRLLLENHPNTAAATR